MNKNTARLRRAKSTRSHIRQLAVPRLTVHRSAQHIYAQVTSANGDKVIASASTVQKALAGELKGTKNKSAAAAVGKASPSVRSRPASRRSRSTARVFVITVASRRWPMRRARRD